MTDLRAGLVEAMATSIRERQGEWTREAEDEWLLDSTSLAAVALDSALGFLTDNADQWTEAAIETPRDTEGGNGALARYFIAALSDSRDTGEKP